MELTKEQFYVYSERFAIMMENDDVDERDARARALKEALSVPKAQRTE